MAGFDPSLLAKFGGDFDVGELKLEDIIQQNMQRAKEILQEVTQPAQNFQKTVGAQKYASLQKSAKPMKKRIKKAEKPEEVKKVEELKVSPEEKLRASVEKYHAEETKLQQLCFEHTADDMDEVGAEKEGKGKEMLLVLLSTYGHDPDAAKMYLERFISDKQREALEAINTAKREDTPENQEKVNQANTTLTNAKEAKRIFWTIAYEYNPGISGDKSAQQVRQSAAKVDHTLESRTGVDNFIKVLMDTPDFQSTFQLFSKFGPPDQQRMIALLALKRLGAHVKRPNIDRAEINDYSQKLMNVREVLNSYKTIQKRLPAYQKLAYREEFFAARAA